MKRQRLVLVLLLCISILFILIGCNAQSISLAKRTLPLSPNEGEVVIPPSDDGPYSKKSEPPTSMLTTVPIEASYPVTEGGAEGGLGIFAATTTNRDTEAMTQEVATKETTSTSSRKTADTTKPATTTRSTTTTRPATTKPATTTTSKETVKTTTSKTTKKYETTTPKTTTTTTRTTSKTTTTKKDSTGTVARTETDKNYKYMGNSNSKILHLTTCDSASRTSMANRVYFETREEAIEKGYKPCGRCKP